MHETITGTTRQELLESFSQELIELNELNQRSEDELVVGKDDEHGIAASLSQIDTNTEVRNNRGKRIHRLEVMIEEIPAWDFCCPACHEAVGLRRIRSSASMLCLSCQEGIELKEKGKNRSRHA